MSYSKKKIYLAGPITGTDYNTSRFGWRKEFADMLSQRGANHLECFSPMREKEFLEKDQCISGAADYESLHGFGTPHGILTRDHNDVRNCDAMVACFLGATRVSIGTCVEFGFAHAYRKPLIMVMEPEVSTVETVEKDEQFDGMLRAGVVSFEAEISRRGYLPGWRVTRQWPNHDGTTTYRILSKRPTGETMKNCHDHVFLRACAGYVVPTLEHAADIAMSLLTPGL